MLPGGDTPAGERAREKRDRAPRARDHARVRDTRGAARRYPTRGSRTHASSVRRNKCGAPARSSARSTPNFSPLPFSASGNLHPRELCRRAAAALNAPPPSVVPLTKFKRISISHFERRPGGETGETRDYVSRIPISAVSLAQPGRTINDRSYALVVSRLLTVGGGGRKQRGLS